MGPRVLRVLHWGLARHVSQVLAEPMAWNQALKRSIHVALCGISVLLAKSIGFVLFRTLGAHLYSLVNQHSYGTSPLSMGNPRFSMGKSTFSMGQSTISTIPGHVSPCITLNADGKCVGMICRWGGCFAWGQGSMYFAHYGGAWPQFPTECCPQATTECHIKPHGFGGFLKGRHRKTFPHVPTI